MIQKSYTLTYAEMHEMAYSFLNAKELLAPKFKNETKAEMQYRMDIAKKRISLALDKLNDRIYGDKDNNDGQRTI